MGLAAVGFVVLGWFGASLTFDGSKYLLGVVERGHAFHPFARYTAETFQYPVLWASSHTSSVPPLRHIFGLSYTVAPFGALLASWLVVRRRAPGLMVWPVLGIGIAALPGLLFPVSESVVLAEWAWPLFLVTLVALDGFSLVAGAGIAAFLFFLHPQSLLVFFAVALVSGVRALREPALRRRLIAWVVGNARCGGTGLCLAPHRPLGARTLALAHEVTERVLEQRVWPAPSCLRPGPLRRPGAAGAPLLVEVSGEPLDSTHSRSPHRASRDLHDCVRIERNAVEKCQ